MSSPVKIIYNGKPVGDGNPLPVRSLTGPIELSKTLTYNLDDTLDVITTTKGTKTMGYNPDGTLASVTGTGIYKDKAFTYVGGLLTEITVS